MLLILHPGITDPGDFEEVREIPLTFFSGDAVGTIRCINITIVDDNAVELEEHFFVSLSSDDPVLIYPIEQSKVVIEDGDGKLTSTPRYESCVLLSFYSLFNLNTTCMYF